MIVIYVACNPHYDLASVMYRQDYINVTLGDCISLKASESDITIGLSFIFTHHCSQSVQRTRLK